MDLDSEMLVKKNRFSKLGASQLILNILAFTLFILLAGWSLYMYSMVINLESSYDGKIKVSIH